MIMDAYRLGALLPFLNRKTGCRQSGFTLAELSVTLFIALILFLFAIPLYKQTSLRSAIQNEAFGLASRLEMAESLAKSAQRAPQQITQFRIRFTSNGYIPEMYDGSGSPTVGWVAAPAISSTAISLGRGITYGSGPISVSPPSQPAGAPSMASEIRFNTRGFPAGIVSGTTVALRGDNAVYLTDGNNYYAVTVNLLGRVQVWYCNSNQWFSASN